MPQNQIYPIATAPGANVLDSATWQTSLARLNGFVAGTAQSNAANKAWRGSSVIASALAQFVVDTTGLDVLDDGDVAGFNAKLKAALATILVASVPPLYSGSANSNSTASAIVANLAPSMTGYAAEGLFIVKVNYPCSGPTTASFNGLPATPIVSYNGSALGGFNWQAGDLVALSYNGNNFVLLNDKTVAASISISVSTVAQLQAAIVAASTMLVTSAAYITINVAAGTYQFTSITGPLYLSHPFGQRLKIIGAPLSAAFPTATQVKNAGTNSATLTLYKTIWSTVFTSVGTDLLQLHAGAMNTIQNILFTGDANNSGGFYGGLMGNWSGEVGLGSAQFVNCAFHNFGLDGLRAEQSSAVQLNNVISTYNARGNFWASHYSVFEVNIGNVAGMYGMYGVRCQNNGMMSIDSASGTCDFSYNTNTGIYATSMGKFDALPATGIRINNNTSYGVVCFAQSQVNLPSYTNFSANGTNLYAGLSGVITALGASVGSCSPGANSTGNNNSIIVA